jgi:hypothetical protein
VASDEWREIVISDQLSLNDENKQVSASEKQFPGFRVQVSALTPETRHLKPMSGRLTPET